MSDFTLAPDRAGIRRSMMNRYNTPGVFPPNSYTMLRGVRGLSGLGSICDDTGAAIAMGIIGAATTTIGGAVGAAGRAGKDAGATSAGEGLVGAGSALGDAWAAACLSAPRGAAMGTTPAEDPATVAARAAAEYEARLTRDRNTELELQATQAQSQNRNLMIGIGVVAVIAVGAGAFALARR